MVLVSPDKIAAVMALAPLPHSFAELDEMVSRGLPAGALKASSGHICVSADAPEGGSVERHDAISLPEAWDAASTAAARCFG